MRLRIWHSAEECLESLSLRYARPWLQNRLPVPLPDLCTHRIHGESSLEEISGIKPGSIQC